MKYAYICPPGGPHPAHELWIETIKAKVFKLNWRGITSLLHYNPEILIGEGSRATFAACLLKKIFLRNTKVISIMMYLPFDILEKKMFPALLSLLKEVDGMIAVSTMVREEIIENIPLDTKVSTCYPYIDVSVYDDVSREYRTSKGICFLGNLARNKGADLLPEIFEEVRGEIGNKISMYIIGKGPYFKELKLKAENLSNLHVLGYQPRRMIKEIFSKCEIYLHPARLDTCPVSVLEGMTAGLIPIVTERTGSKAFVEKVSPTLITPVDTEEISKKVIDVLGMDPRGRSGLSLKAKQIALGWSAEVASRSFNEAMEELLEQDL